IGLQVLQVVVSANRPLTMGDIAVACGLSKSRLHRYLTSLYRTGMLTRDEDLRYTPGPALLAMGSQVVHNWDIRALARPVLRRLRERLNETVALSVWTAQGPCFVHWEESTRAVNIGIRVGSYVSTLKSAGGKVFLAFLPASETQEVLARELAETGLSLAWIQQELATIRERGYATTEDSLLPGIYSIGSPVFDGAHRVVAAITVVGIAGYLDGSANSPVVQILKEECERLSASLHGSSRSHL
ncbi:MAG: IclR family transcriptional regulator, partial [Alicyclobacillus sp.]|nr:IclR family transcriptional regulator [Alicyclobacillus sp.]